METLISRGVVDDIKIFTNVGMKYDMGSIITTLKNDAEQEISRLDNGHKPVVIQSYGAYGGSQHRDAHLQGLLLELKSMSDDMV